MLITTTTKGGKSEGLRQWHKLQEVQIQDQRAISFVHTATTVFIFWKIYISVSYGLYKQSGWWMFWYKFSFKNHKTHSWLMYLSATAKGQPNLSPKDYSTDYHFLAVTSLWWFWTYTTYKHFLKRVYWSEGLFQKLDIAEEAIGQKWSFQEMFWCYINENTVSNHYGMGIFLFWWLLICPLMTNLQIIMITTANCSLKLGSTSPHVIVVHVL